MYERMLADGAQPTAATYNRPHLRLWQDRQGKRANHIVCFGCPETYITICNASFSLLSPVQQCTLPPVEN